MPKLFYILFVFLTVTPILADQLTGWGKDDAGWTIFHTDSSTRLHYVSSSGGDDATAQFYSPDDPLIGADPFMPVGTIKAFKTVAAAVEAARDKSADWVMLKRGDVWYETLSAKMGKSAEQPFVYGAYGAAKERPLLKTGDQAGISLCCKDHGNFVVTGIHFYAHTRDFNSTEYKSQVGAAGVDAYVAEGYKGSMVLFEDNLFRFYTNNIYQGPGSISDIVFRRNLFLDNYSADGHSQGMYTNNVSLTLEENVFDHNGWFKQQLDQGSEQDSGQATMFNHNTYFNCISAR